MQGKTGQNTQAGLSVEILDMFLFLEICIIIMSLCVHVCI